MTVPLRNLVPLPSARVSPIAIPFPAERRVADIIVDTLVRLGVDTFFGIPGGAICSVYDALEPRGDVHVINTRHESGAAFMAMGFSRIGGAMPAVLTTSGPGITNALTGLAAAHADGVPLLVLCGEVPKKNFGRGALQEGSRYHLDVLGMARSITKFAAELTNPHAVVSTIRKAVAAARTGRPGPVLLTLPLDVSNERIVPSSLSCDEEVRFGLNEQLLTQAAAALERAKRPLILAGSGARHPETVRYLRALATGWGIPVATTPKAKGVFPETHPLSLGIFGHGGHLSAAEYLEEGIDVLLCVGSGLGETGTNSWSAALKPSDAFIQIDVDAAQIGKNYQVNYGIVGQAEVVLRKLLSRVDRPPAMNGVAGRRHHPIERIADADGLHPADAITALQQIMPAKTIYTADIGEHMLFALHYLSLDEPDAFFVNSGFGSMGSGIGAAIGAKVAKPMRPVASICGDFGFQMFGFELATCVEGAVGVTFLILNDARMGMVESGMMRLFGRSLPMRSDRFDFAAFARSMGAHGFSINQLSDFERIPPWALTGTVPAVLDVRVDPRYAFPTHGRVAQLKNFVE